MNLLAKAAPATLFVSLGLLASLPAAAASTGNALLTGEYMSTGTTNCLTAKAGGFDSSLHPVVPARTYISSNTGENLWVFNGAGSVSVTGTNVSAAVAAAAPSNPFDPSASGDNHAGTRKYVVGAGHIVTVTATNAKGKFFAGPRTGQTFVINKYVLFGHVSSDGSRITLATPSPAVETITFSNGDSFERVCHRSAVVLKR
jgi:hypothetical protein